RLTLLMFSDVADPTPLKTRPLPATRISKCSCSTLHNMYLCGGLIILIVQIGESQSAAIAEEKRCAMPRMAGTKCHCTSRFNVTVVPFGPLSATCSCLLFAKKGFSDSSRGQLSSHPFAIARRAYLPGVTIAKAKLPSVLLCARRKDAGAFNEASGISTTITPRAGLLPFRTSPSIRTYPP